MRGSPYDDHILGSNLANVLLGKGGADTFVFDLAVAPEAVDHILDYNQGNSGIFNSAEGDTFDFSALLRGQRPMVGNLVRVLENPAGNGAILQIDQDGIINGARWTTVALLDGVHTGEAVKITFDTSLPSAAPTVTGFALTAWDGALAADFNGDRKADILGRTITACPRFGR